MRASFVASASASFKRKHPDTPARMAAKHQQPRHHCVVLEAHTNHCTALDKRLVSVHNHHNDKFHRCAVQLDITTPTRTIWSDSITRVVFLPLCACPTRLFARLLLSLRPVLARITIPADRVWLRLLVLLSVCVELLEFHCHATARCDQRPSDCATETEAPHAETDRTQRWRVGPRLPPVR